MSHHSLFNNHFTIKKVLVLLPSLWREGLGISLFVIALTLTACSELSRDQRRARQAAEHCYELLQKGKYERFVNHIAYADSMSDDYRSQMVDLIREHGEALRAQHGRITDVRASGDVIHGDQAHVFLQVTFADSTCEEVGLPMTRVGKKWRMQ